MYGSDCCNPWTPLSRSLWQCCDFLSLTDPTLARLPTQKPAFISVLNKCLFNTAKFEWILDQHYLASNWGDNIGKKYARNVGDGSFAEHIKWWMGCLGRIQFWFDHCRRTPSEQSPNIKNFSCMTLEQMFLNILYLFLTIMVSDDVKVQGRFIYIGLR